MRKRSSTFLNVAARVFDTPLLIEQRKLDAILGVLGPRLDFGVAEPVDEPLAHRTPQDHMEAFASIIHGAQMADQRVRVERHDEGYTSVGRLAIVPVIGTLIQRSDWMSESSGMMSYQRIERAFSAALQNPDVAEIILEIDSPGGEVAGAFDLADRIYSARNDKPITAVAAEFAASAAYLIASAATEIVVPRTGAVGSIGVVAAHNDYSVALEKKGIAVTFVYAGAKKIDGNPYMPLSESAQADWQKDIDRLYGLFVETVARNRAMAPAMIQTTEAGIFMGEDAVQAGLADRVNTFSNEISNGLIRPSGGNLRLFISPSKEASMSQKTGGASNTAAATTSTANAPATEVAPAAAAPAAAPATAAAAPQASASEERMRIKGILAHAEASGRDALAQHLAYDTSMSVDDAVKLLSLAPKATAATAAAPATGSAGELRAAMAKKGTPGVGADEAPGGTQGGDANAANVVKIDVGKIYGKRNAGRTERMNKFDTGAPRSR